MRRAAKELAQRAQALGGQLASSNQGAAASPAGALALRALSSQGASPSGRPHGAAQGAKPSATRPAAAAQALATGGTAVGVPPVPKFLGLAGAIPFLALSPPIAAGLPFLPADLVTNAALLQVGYGATIASFLGGIHWALAMVNYGRASAAVNRDRYLWSVTPCLLAWPAVVLQPGPGSLIAASTLGVVYIMDRHFASRGLLPPWYMSLRKPLTLAAVGGLSVTCVASIVVDSQDPGHPGGAAAAEQAA